MSRQQAKHERLHSDRLQAQEERTLDSLELAPTRGVGLGGGGRGGDWEGGGGGGGGV